MAMAVGEARSGYRSPRLKSTATAPLMTQGDIWYGKAAVVEVGLSGGDCGSSGGSSVCGGCMLVSVAAVTETTALKKGGCWLSVAALTAQLNQQRARCGGPDRASGTPIPSCHRRTEEDSIKRYEWTHS